MWDELLAAYRAGDVPWQALQDLAADDPLFRIWLYEATNKE